MTIIGRTIKDGDVISIIRKYLVSGIMIDDEYEDSVVGTPQGGNLSPLLANIMLNELDKEMEKRGLNFVRYADDCIIMVGSEMSANRVMRNISRFIEEKLGLKVKDLIKNLNPKITGWKNYYSTKTNEKWMQALDWYIICSFARWYNKKHRRRHHMSKVGFVRNSIYEKGLKKMAKA